jgi:hypothetical protein
LANYTGQFYSTKWLRKNILKQSDEEMQEIDKEMQDEAAVAMEQQMMQQQNGQTEDEEASPEEQ